MPRLHGLNAAFALYVQRPDPIQNASDCEKRHCFEHPEQSECRGLCRRQAEIRNVEHVQLRASGTYRSPRNVDAMEVQRAIADRDKPPPEKCNFRACQDDAIRSQLKDSVAIETGAAVNSNAPMYSTSSGLVESNCGHPELLPAYRWSKVRSQRCSNFL